MTTSLPIVRWLLIASPFCAAAALALTWWGLLCEPAYLHDQPGTARRMFDTAAHLVFEPPNGHEQFRSTQFSAARVFVVLFGLTTSLGIVLAASRTAREGWIRTTFWFDRRFLGRQPSIVIGLGSVLAPLVKELRATRPVFAIDVRTDGPGVDEARDLGALVISGDAADAAIRAKVDVRIAREIFISTGDDMRNLAIAAGLSQDAASLLRGRPPEEPVTVYVHSAKPARSATVEGYALLRERATAIQIVPFSTADLAARHLFFAAHGGLATSDWTVPGPEEVFHLFVFGFGATGQAVALHSARFAHFASRLRPRLTIYIEKEAFEDAKRRFLQRHPALTPSNLDLSSTPFLSVGDGWDVRPGRPVAEEYHRGTQEDVTDNGASRRVRPVEYAVNAEFRQFVLDADAAEVAAEIAARLRPLHGPRVRPAAVICFDESRQNFSAALQIRDAMARRILDDSLKEGATQSKAPVLPLHIYFPDDSTLAAVLQGAHDLRDDDPLTRAFPFRIFGQSKHVTSFAAITGGPFRDMASEIRASYEILAGRKARDHPDFDDSNLDAALHAEALKLPAIGLEFRRASELDEQGDTIDGVHPAPLLARLWRRDVRTEADRLFAAGRIQDDGRLDISAEELERLPPLVRQRLSILDHVYVPRMNRPETQEDATRRMRLQRIVQASVAQALQLLDAELRERKGALDLFAEMEHNRWMGERFAKGWSFGTGSDIRRRRPSFVPWQDLSESDRDIDRAQLARLIVGRAGKGLYAYVILDRAVRSSFLNFNGPVEGARFDSPKRQSRAGFPKRSGDHKPSPSP